MCTVAKLGAEGRAKTAPVTVTCVRIYTNNLARNSFAMLADVFLLAFLFVRVMVCSVPSPALMKSRTRQLQQGGNAVPESSSTGSTWPRTGCPWAIRVKYAVRLKSDGKVAMAVPTSAPSNGGTVATQSEDSSTDNCLYVETIEGCGQHNEQCDNARPLRAPEWKLHPRVQVRSPSSVFSDQNLHVCMYVCELARRRFAAAAVGHQQPRHSCSSSSITDWYVAVHESRSLSIVGHYLKHR
jgi:hypothetical protein